MLDCEQPSGRRPHTRERVCSRRNNENLRVRDALARGCSRNDVPTEIVASTGRRFAQPLLTSSGVDCDDVKLFKSKLLNLFQTNEKSQYARYSV